MYVDIICNNRTFTDDDIRVVLFNGVEMGLRGMSMLPHFIPSIKDFAVEGFDLACLIDYPYGSSDVSVRSHAALTAIRKGATTLDLVVNNGLFFSKKKDKFYDDIETIYKLCQEHGIMARLMLEYRLFESKDIVDIGNKCREIGIEYILPSTGSQLDNWEDNLAISMELTNKANINVITNGAVVTPLQRESVEKSGVFGLRFSSLQAAKNAQFGV